MHLHRLNWLYSIFHILLSMSASDTAAFSQPKHSMRMCARSAKGEIPSLSQQGLPRISEVVPVSVDRITRDQTKATVASFMAVSLVLLQRGVACASDAAVKPIPLMSDEFEVIIRGAYLGIGLTELEYGDKKNTRVCVQSVKENADESVINMVKPGMILVALNAVNVEGQDRSQVIESIKAAPRPLSLVFRSREMFFQKLNSSSPDSGGAVNLVVETAISPSQTLRVERLEKGKGACVRSAAIGDVVEVSYQVRIAGDESSGGQGQLIDGAKVLASQGSRPSDDSIYFVLGPASSNAPSSYSSGSALPSGWDASVRGMCVGERRLITLPAKLAFGKEGLELKKEMGKPAANRIPPNSALKIDVRLLSLNGVA